MCGWSFRSHRILMLCIRHVVCGMHASSLISMYAYTKCMYLASQLWSVYNMTTYVPTHTHTWITAVALRTTACEIFNRMNVCTRTPWNVHFIHTRDALRREQRTCTHSISTYADAYAHTFACKKYAFPQYLLYPTFSSWHRPSLGRSNELLTAHIHIYTNIYILKVYMHTVLTLSNILFLT